MALIFTPVATDAFTRANETPLAGSGWADNRNNGNTLNLSSNTVVPNNVGQGAHYINSTVLTADQYAQCAVTVVGTAGDAGMGIQVRGGFTGGGNENKYYAVADDVAVTVFRYESATFNVIGTRSVTWVDGDILRLAVISDQLTVYQNGVQLGAAITDANLTTGKAGVVFSASVTSGSLDNWECGNVTESAGGIVIPVVYHHRQRNF